MKRFILLMAFVAGTLSIVSPSFSNEASAQTFRNPIINADVPDIALCHADGYYYMVSTTMHLMPGCPVMRSKDMIHWETVSYVYDRIEDGDRYDLKDGKTVYGQGQWASTIRHHNGKFYVWFTANGAPGKGFIFSADKAEGPWKLIARPKHHHDASLFFDTDGKAYLFHGSGGCSVVQLKDDLSDVDPNGINQRIIFNDPDERGGLLEGSQVFKHKGKYYVCMISMVWGVPGRVRREVCYRSDNILGPYEKHIVLETPFEEYGGVGQGCILNGNDEDDNDESNWWAMIFQDRGGIGRVPCAMRVTWVDGWPMCGELNAGNYEKISPKSYHIPNDTSKDFEDWTGIVGSDEFNGNKLSLLWQWNHNPINKGWAIKNGNLRLTTARLANSIFDAPNTLTQRMTAPACTGEICLNISGMKSGDRAGLAGFNGDSGVLTISKDGKKVTLSLTEEHMRLKRGEKVIDHIDKKELASVDITSSLKKNRGRLYLRVHGDFLHQADLCTFAYSLDGKEWKEIGTAVKTPFDYTRFFMGTKFAIFNYATKSLGGHVDVDYFHYDKK
ncbi:MAG: glycoside hydrolase 43 family protein [Prevotella sp.]|nr:glycoside hydrolase 43 family protein [Prevotella sp.]